MKHTPLNARFVVTVAALLIGVSSAHAAEKARPASAPVAARSNDRVLTPAQLRECVLQRDELRGQTDAAVKSKADLAADKAEIDTTGKALDEALTTLDRTNAEAVASYNAKVMERRAALTAYEAKVDVYNGKVEAIQTSRSGYDKACENRRYDERDLNDMQRKK